MKAAVLTSIPGELSVDDVAIDKPQKNEVLIRTAAAGLCHSDLHFMEGKYPYPTPAVLGPRVGRRRRGGRRGRHLREARRPRHHLPVGVLRPLRVLPDRTHEPLRRQEPGGPRLRRQPPRLSKNGQPVFQFLDLSSFAEQMLVHENAVVKIRDDMPLDRAALIGCGVTTGVGAVFNTARVRAGQHGRRDRLRRRRAQLHPGRRASPARPHHRRRHGAAEARARRAVRRHRPRRRIEGSTRSGRCRS